MLQKQLHNGLVMFMVDDPPTRCKLLAVGSDNTLETYYVDQDEMEHEEDAPAGAPAR